MTAVVRRSLARPATLEGVGLHSGATVHVRLLPAAPGTGVVFVRADLPGAPRLGLRDVPSSCAPFRTMLQRGAVEVHTVEHLLAACAGLEITDLEIVLDGAEVPGLDGSALPFAQALLAAGVIALPGTEVPVLVVRRECRVEGDGARICAAPGPAGLSITYTLHYPEEPLAQGMASFLIDPATFLREIAPARTFCLRREVDALRAAGLGRGASTQNTLVLDGGRAVDQSLRFPNEPVRHKILDLLGDLYLLGRPLHGRVVAERSGHRLNRLLVDKLLSEEPL